MLKRLLLTVFCATTSLVAQCSSQSGHTMQYYGGHVPNGTTYLQAIYYGTWGTTELGGGNPWTYGSGLENVVTDAANTIAGTAAWGDASGQYCDGGGTPTAFGDIHGGGISIDSGSQGTGSISNALGAVFYALDNARLSYSSSNLYVVFLGPNVTTSELTGACGKHGLSQYNGQPLHFALIAYPGTGSCGVWSLSTPNYHIHDQILMQLFHEVVEDITNSDGNGWHSSTGQEVEDACAFNLGSNGTQNYLGQWYSFTSSNTGLTYPIQAPWKNSTGTCY